MAMCSGAVRTYLMELDALPDAPLVAMVPVGLNAKQSHVASGEGGNAVGAVMVQLATDKDDPADRLASIHRSMKDGKEALSSMTPVQIVAMSALGQAPAILTPMLRMQGIVRPPYNLIISNVPGPRSTHYWNGAKLVGTYPRLDPDQRHGPQHHLHVVRRQHDVRSHRLPPHGAAPAAHAHPPRRRGGRAGEGRRHLSRSTRGGPHDHSTGPGVVRADRPSRASAAAAEPTTPAQPGPTFFLNLATIPGSATAKGFAGQIPLLTWGWGVDSSASVLVGGGAGTGKPTPQDVVLRARTGIQSPKILAAVNTGRHLQSALLTCVKPGNRPFTFMTLTFEDVLVTGYYVTPDPKDGVPLDLVRLKFAKVTQSSSPRTRTVRRASRSSRRSTTRPTPPARDVGHSR